MKNKKTVQEAFEEIFKRLHSLEDFSVTARDIAKYKKLINEHQVINIPISIADFNLPLILFEGTPIKYGRHVLRRDMTETHSFNDHALTDLIDTNTIATAPVITADGTLLYTSEENSYFIPAPRLFFSLEKTRRDSHHALGVTIKVPISGTGPEGAGLKTVATMREYKYENDTWFFREQIKLDLTDSNPDVDPTEPWHKFTTIRDNAPWSDTLNFIVFERTSASRDKEEYDNALAQLRSTDAGKEIHDAYQAFADLEVSTVQLFGFIVNIHFSKFVSINAMRFFGSGNEPEFFGVTAEGKQTSIPLPTNIDEVYDLVDTYVHGLIKFPYRPMQSSPVDDMSTIQDVTEFWQDVLSYNYDP